MMSAWRNLNLKLKILKINYQVGLIYINNDLLLIIGTNYISYNFLIILPVLRVLMLTKSIVIPTCNMLLELHILLK